MPQFAWLLLASCAATCPIAQEDTVEMSGSAGVRDIFRAVGGESGAMIQLSRETLDLILRTPTMVTTSKLASILPDDAFRWGKGEGSRSGSVSSSLWSAGIESVLGESIELLGDIVSHGRWTVVRPAEGEETVNPASAPPVQARMAIPLGLELPVEARLGIETDSIREEYFVFSTELGTSSLEAKWLAWSTRIDYRSSVEAPRSARAEQRVGVKFGSRDTIGISGRIEDRNLDLAASPVVDLAPSGELFWSHRWLTSLESVLKVQQVLPDLQSLWLAEPGSTVQMEANVRASLRAATKLDLRGTATQDLSHFGIGLQLEFLLGTPIPQPPQRIMLPDRSEEETADRQPENSRSSI